jgi:hypothetical protein
MSETTTDAAVLISVPRCARSAIDPGRPVWVSGTNTNDDITLHRIEKILGVFSAIASNFNAASLGLRRPGSRARTVAGTGVYGASEHSLREVKALSELYDFILVPWPGSAGAHFGRGEWNTDWHRLGDKHGSFHHDQEITAWQSAVHSRWFRQAWGGCGHPSGSKCSWPFRSLRGRSQAARSSGTGTASESRDHLPYPISSSPRDPCHG